MFRMSAQVLSCLFQVWVVEFLLRWLPPILNYEAVLGATLDDVGSLIVRQMRLENTFWVPFLCPNQ